MCVLSAPSTNFQANWTTRSKVGDFSHFIFRVSLPIVGGGVNLLFFFVKSPFGGGNSSDIDDDAGSDDNGGGDNGGNSPI